MGRVPCCNKNGLKKGPWTPEEDKKLIDYIQKNGQRNWRTLPKNAGLARCGKSCRLRWTNYLRPDIKRGRFSFEEEEAIIQLHSILGNKWSTIAAQLPGRTDNEIKNYWNTRIRKRLLRMGIDPVTHAPRPDLLELSSLLASSPFYNLSQLDNIISQLLLSSKQITNPELLKLATSALFPSQCGQLNPNLFYQQQNSNSMQDHIMNQNQLLSFPQVQDSTTLTPNVDSHIEQLHSDAPTITDQFWQLDQLQIYQDFATDHSIYDTQMLSELLMPDNSNSYDAAANNDCQCFNAASVVSTPVSSPTDYHQLNYTSSTNYTNSNSTDDEGSSSSYYNENLINFQIPSLLCTSDLL